MKAMTDKSQSLLPNISNKSLQVYSLDQIHPRSASDRFPSSSPPHCTCWDRMIQPTSTPGNCGFGLDLAQLVDYSHPKYMIVISRF